MTDTSNRSRVQAGVPAGGEFATQARAENPDLPAPVTIEPFQGRIVPQKNIGYFTDISRALVGLSAEDHAEALRVAQRHVALKNEVAFVTDAITNAVIESGAIQQKGIRVTAHSQALVDYLTEHPAWVEDGITPHPTGGYVHVERAGQYVEYQNAAGHLHREDGPAEIRTSRETGKWSRKSYYLNGVPHRDKNLPSTLWDNGRKEWRVDGVLIAELHRPIEGELRMGPE